MSVFIDDGVPGTWADVLPHLTQVEVSDFERPALPRARNRTGKLLATSTYNRPYAL